MSLFNSVASILGNSNGSFLTLEETGSIGSTSSYNPRDVTQEFTGPGIFISETMSSSSQTTTSKITSLIVDDVSLGIVKAISTLTGNNSQVSSVFVTDIFSVSMVTVNASSVSTAYYRYVIPFKNSLSITVKAESSLRYGIYR